MKSNYLNFFALLLLIFESTVGHAIKPVVPSDVLSEGEIQEIHNNKDFFFASRLEDDDRPIWDHMDRKYGHHYLNPRTQYFSREGVIHRTLSDGFPTHYSIQELYRARLNIHTVLGSVVPRLGITFGEGQYGINENNLFTNLFDFVLPNHWFELIQAGIANHATKYMFIKTILDQYYAAEFLYLDLHKLIQDFEIRNFYLVHLQLLNDHLGDSDQNDVTLAGTFSALGTEMATNRGDVKLRFDDLAEIMALRTDKDGLFAADHLNIENIRDFPKSVRELEELNTYYNNKEDFIIEVLNKSPELKAIKEFYQMAKLGIGVTAFGSMFSTVPNVDDNDYASFGFSAGYDTLPQILTSYSLTKTAKIDVEAQFVAMVEAARRAFDTYTNSLGGYTEARRAMHLNRKALATHLRQIVREGAPVNAMFLRDFSNLIQSELLLNKALHGSLQAHAWMRRLLVTEEENILKYLPEDREIHRIQRFFLAKYPEYSAKGSHMDSTIRHLRTAKQLRAFLNGNYKNLDDETDEFHKDDVKNLVTENMSALLHRVPLIHLKHRKFYRTLNDYVVANDVDITLTDERLLKRRAHIPFKKVEFRHQRHMLPGAVMCLLHPGRHLD